MISVFIFDSGPRKGGREISINSTGHGDPVVCAGVGTLIQTMAGYLANLKEYNFSAMTVNVRQGNGTILIDTTVVRDAPEVIHTVLDTIVSLLVYGLESIRLDKTGGANLTCEYLVDLDDGVPLADARDCVHEWRASNGVQTSALVPPRKVTNLPC